MHRPRRSRSPAVGAAGGASAATCPGVGGSRAAPLSAAPRRSALPTPGGAVCQTWPPWQEVPACSHVENCAFCSTRGPGFRSPCLSERRGAGGCKEQGSQTLQSSLFTCESCQACRLPARGRGAGRCAPVGSGAVPSYLPHRASGARGLAWVQSHMPPQGPVAAASARRGGRRLLWA